jgi:hypothetical protein
MRRKSDPFDKPWVIIAAVIGIIAVVIIALAFFMSGGLGGTAGSSNQQESRSGNSASPQQTVVVGVAPSVIKTQVPVVVPTEGVFVKVSYLGSFSGRYGVVGDLQTVRNSGDRVFAIENATGTVLADFNKEDSSSRHDLTVEIWKDGKAQKIASNSSGFGEVNVTYTL